VKRVAILGLLLAGCATAPRPTSTLRVVDPSRPDDVRSRQEGKASWYGKEQHGHLTANGEHFDMHALTAAHKTLPMHSRVRVTNKLNGKSVIVRINDRGPYARGRVIDLSYAAARAIDMIDRGVVPVLVEVLR
jgi:rare lipoprotein A